MKRKIITIDESKCNGCGLCAAACHEGAIGMVDGVAKLLREDYCDGLGDCLPACPAGAITFEEREAPAYDAEAVRKAQNAAHAHQENQDRASQENQGGASQEDQDGATRNPLPCGCPGSQSRSIRREDDPEDRTGSHSQGASADRPAAVSRLSQWPVQIQLAPVNAPYFDGANLLIAADCTAFAYGNFHEEFIRGRVTLIGCPKLDDVDYTEKLTAILAQNDIKSLTIVRMEVPCCGGIEMAARNALQASGKFIPWQVVTISIDGRKLNPCG